MLKSLQAVETQTDGGMQSVFHYAKTLEGEYSAAISLSCYAPKRKTRCTQTTNYAKTPKVHAALQSVFLGTHLNGRWYAISLPNMLKP